MIKHYIGLSLVSASLLMAGCSSSDDDADPAATTDGTTTEGTTTEGTTTEGTTTEGTTTEGTTTAGGSTYTAPADATMDITAMLPAELVNALSTNGIALEDGTNYTIFAPTSQAITDASVADGLLDPAASTEDQSAVLTYHVIEGVFAADPGDTGATAVSVGNLTTLNGALVAIADDGNGGLTYGGQAITATDAFGVNGVVHTIDGVADPADAPEGTTTAGTTTEGTTTEGTTTEGTTTEGTTTEGTTTAGTTTGGSGNCGQSGPVAGSIYEALAGDSRVAAFTAASETGDQLCLNFNDAGTTWTVFAPTDAAIGTASVTDTIIRQHIYTNGPLATAAEIQTVGDTINTGGTGLTTALNDQAAVSSGGTVVGGATIVDTIVTSGGGVVHIIDGILAFE